MPRTRRTQYSDVALILDGITKRQYAMDEIPETFHNDIIKKAQEKLRILNTKFPLQQPLCNGDSERSRSAIALEFVLRKGIVKKDGGGGLEFHANVPLHVLGREVGCEKKQIESLALLVRKHLEEKVDGARGTSRKNIGSNRASTRIKKIMSKKNNNPSVAKPKVAKVSASKGKPSTPLRIQMEAAKAKRALSKQNPAIIGAGKIKSGISSSSTSTSASRSSPDASKKKSGAAMQPIKPIYFHNLAMKLQSKLHDPDTCEKKSKEIFYSLVEFKLTDSESKSHVRKTHIRRDIVDNLKMYEASCFFIASKEMEQGRVGLRDVILTENRLELPSAHPNKRKRRRKGGAKEGIESDDEESGEVLTIEDVAGVLREIPTELSNFVKDLLPVVERMRAARKVETKRIKENEYKNQRQASNKRRGQKLRAQIEEGEQPHPTRQHYLNTIVGNKIDESKDEEPSSFDVVDSEAVKDLSITPPMSPPHNSTALYSNQEAYDLWENTMIEKLKQPGETREDMIIRHFAEILKRYC